MNDHQLWGRVVTARSDLEALAKEFEDETPDPKTHILLNQTAVAQLGFLIEDLVAEIDYLEDEVDTLGEYVFS
jgi:hypothetical protein